MGASPRNQARPERPIKLGAIRIFFAIAAAGAAYLSWLSFTGAHVVGCGPSSGCGDVLASRWSSFLTIPVGLMALMTYGAALGLTGLLGERTPAPKRRIAWSGLLSCALASLGGAIWFTGLQFLVLKKFCPFCLTTHAAATIAAVLVIRATPIRKVGSWGSGPISFSAAEFGRIAAAAVAGLLALIAGQSLYRAPTYRVTSVQAMAPTPTNAVSPPPRSLDGPTFSLVGGKFVLRLGEDPMMGPAQAPHVVVCLFDYTCPHCRQLHGLLREAQQTFGNDLAIVTLATPLNAECNPSIQQTKPTHADACMYARFGIALWRINPALSQQYDEWIFGTEPMPSLEAAREKAAQLAGAGALAKTLQDAATDEWLRRNASIYETTFVQAHYGVLPQMFVGSVFVTGPPSDPKNLYRLFHQEFGLGGPI